MCSYFHICHSQQSYRLLVSGVPPIAAILNEATHPWSTKRFDIFGSIHTKTIWPFLKINSISSHASDVTYLVEIRICRLQLEEQID